QACRLPPAQSAAPGRYPRGPLLSPAARSPPPRPPLPPHDVDLRGHRDCPLLAPPASGAPGGGRGAALPVGAARRGLTRRASRSTSRGRRASRSRRRGESVTEPPPCEANEYKVCAILWAVMGRGDRKSVV